MDDDFWGPEIVVNGVRPKWLTGHVTCDLWTGSSWCCSSDREPHYNEAEKWTWTHDHLSHNPPNITKIRLPKDHPYYISPKSIVRDVKLTPEQACCLVGQGTSVQCPYCDKRAFSESHSWKFSGIVQHIKMKHGHLAGEFMKLVQQGKAEREEKDHQQKQEANDKLIRVHTVSGEFIQQIMGMLDPFDDSVIYETLEEIFNSNECKVW